MLTARYKGVMQFTYTDRSPLTGTNAGVFNDVGPTLWSWS
ncbi:tRNA G26 N,N-dimethylase Trm1 [Nocardioides ginsengisegetis]|uniref:tRNA G26 N,N-dimethylase Trm1 n=1 Tax=Nocardioides ginsengisegetis TaxID=661491 RepID=A0A7W3IWK3_9ACTN|nr:tRNA G26 N,N-dimethylase Trm1 [Nocardioides ginsengisegetis]